MNRNMLFKMAAGVGLFFPTAFLQAAEGEAAQLRLSHGVLRYEMDKEEVDDGSDTETTEATRLTTFPAGLEIAAFWNGMAAYVYPESQGSSSFLLGKAFGGNQEVGVSASINFINVKDDDEASGNSFGAYYFYSRPLSPGLTFEFDINPSLIMGKEKNVENNNTAETETSGYSLYLDFLGVIPLAKNFEYVFGLDYTWKKLEIDVKPATGPSSTEKVDSSNLGLILAKFRYFI